ncbi:MAG: sugar phosphate isomerase/epimerase [Verrucomicrobia bacterium]|nr:sugar phosphate isomerase/epimerase [Verrucomicrobiota bacterium]
MQTRRQFLQQTATAAALAAFAPASRAAGSGISLGFSLYGMKTVPLDEALRTCAEIGYRNVELALNPGFPTEPKLLSADARKNLRSRLVSLRLDVSALMLNLSLTANDDAHAKNLDALKAAAQLAQDLALQQPIAETVLGGKPAEWDNIKDRMAEHLQSWAAVAATGKLTLAVKAHVGSAVNSPERLLWLVGKANSPAVKVAYDYSHFQLAGVPLADSLKALLPQTRFIHLKDATGDAKKFQFLLPGEGKTDYAAYFKLLKQLGYNGPAVVEVSGQIFNKPGYDPIAAAKKCFAVLSAALTAK